MEQEVIEPVLEEYKVISQDEELQTISVCLEAIHRHCIQHHYGLARNETTTSLDERKAHNIVVYLFERFFLREEEE